MIIGGGDLYATYAMQVTSNFNKKLSGDRPTDYNTKSITVGICVQ